MNKKFIKNKIDISDESKIITSAIISTEFLKNTIDFLDTSLFDIKTSKTICRWCIDYYNRYKKAPNKTIKDIYESEKEKIDEDSAEFISDFLVNISNSYDESKYNVEYEIDRAEKFFRKKNLTKTNEQLKGAIINNSIEDAEHIIANYKRINKQSVNGIDVFGDDRPLTDVFFTEDDDYILKFPGTLGNFLGGFNREDLVAVAAPPKRGKSWWMQEMAILGMVNGLNVLFVSLEMPQRQVLRRIYMRILSETKSGKETDVNMPYFFEDTGEIKYKTVHKSGIRHDRTKRKIESIRRMMKSNKFKLMCFPAYSLDIDEFSTILDNLEDYDGFVPDIIVADYFDIFKTSKRVEHRNQIDYIWKTGRSIAQKKHALFITGSHSSRGTFNKDIGEADITEDIRKLNHVSCMFALNQTEEEKENGIMRIKTLVNRHSEFNTQHEVVVLQQLAIGRPILDSRMKYEVEL